MKATVKCATSERHPRERLSALGIVRVKARRRRCSQPCIPPAIPSMFATLCATRHKDPGNGDPSGGREATQAARETGQPSQEQWGSSRVGRTPSPRQAARSRDPGTATAHPSGARLGPAREGRHGIARPTPSPPPASAHQRR